MKKDEQIYNCNGDFNSPLSIMDRINRQTFSKDLEDGLEQPTNQLGLIAFYFVQ